MDHMVLLGLYIMILNGRMNLMKVHCCLWLYSECDSLWSLDICHEMKIVFFSSHIFPRIFFILNHDVFILYFIICVFISVLSFLYCMICISFLYCMMCIALFLFFNELSMSSCNY